MSLLGRFGLLSLIVIVILGLGLATVLKGQIERLALGGASELAEVLAQAELEPRLSSHDLEAPLSESRVNQLDRDLATARFRHRGLEGVKIFNRRAELVYSDDGNGIGSRHRESDELRRALAGDATTKVVTVLQHDGRGARVLEAHVPLRKLDGVLEVHLSYEPVAAAIERDKRMLYLLLAGGLALLYAALFRIVSGASRRLRHLALHDPLTGLPNRNLFQERAERVISGRTRGRLAAVLLIDLDRFKEVNDTLGHNSGDQLLKEVAERLGGAIRGHDMLARLGGDEFAVLLTGMPNRGTAAEAAGRLQDTLRRPFVLRDVAMELDASIGVALCPEHGDDVSTLLQRADVAMYEAKRAQGHIQTYAPERDPYTLGRLGLLGELRRAIELDELVLHYQPKVELSSGAVCGVEALVRWQHPERGLLQPGEFVPLAERTGTIAHLTHWVLDAALAQCALWRDEGLDMPVAVNLAGANVVDVSLPRQVQRLLRKHGLAGDSLECEVSEGTVMSDPVLVVEVLEDLRRLGIRLSLDDYGTGRSSLAYLKRLPLDELKIDRSFITDMDTDDYDAVIVRSTIDLAHQLGLDVVAEGVENQLVLDELARLGCTIAQGYFLSHPLPAGELAGWLAARRRAASAAQ